MTSKAGVTHGYNDLELLNQVGASTSLDWDSESRRLRMTCTAGVYEFVYDPTASIPAVLYETRTTGNVRYIREPDGRLVARIGGEGAVFYHFDHIGNTVALTDSLGTVTDRYDYGSWGGITHISGTTSDNPYLYVGELGYYNHWQDPTMAAFLQLGVRYYEPGVGRFSQRDGIDDGTGDALYIYVRNVPTRYFDPSGLLWCEWKKWRGIPYLVCHWVPKPKPAQDLVECTLRDIMSRILDATSCFPIGSLITELEKVRKMTPEERQNIMESCQPFMEEACSDNDNCSDNKITLYATCNECCRALSDYLGASHLYPLCRSDVMCGKLGP